MRKNIVAILLVMLVLVSCTSTKKSEIPKVQGTENITRLGVQTGEPREKIRLVGSTRKVGRGDKGSITIEGQPGVVYNATAVYNSGRNMVTAFEYKTAGPDGRVTWVWNVRKDTLPGSYPITIFGGGESLSTYYTVAG